jgi:hydroxyacylglutathione hydrolase
MIQIQSFTFNPFQENTYVLYDESKQCLIIDPGCSNTSEQQELSDFIKEEELTPVKLLNTHCHIDHILGNKYVSDTWKLLPEIHEKDLVILHSGVKTAQLYGIPYYTSPDPIAYIKEGDTLAFGNSELQVIFTPGHSPGSIIFYNTAQKFAIAGDVLFRESIGRTDFPLCSHSDLMDSIKTKLFLLPDDLVVYPGHGPETTIGHEKQHNPFL